MRGRRPDPAAVKQAKGNPGRRPIGEAPSAPALTDDALHSAPDWLNESAKAIWARLAPDLAAMRLLSRPDVNAFGRYCLWFSHWLAAMEGLAAGELVVRTESEHVSMDRLNKNLQAALLIEKRLIDMEDRFGLNPSNRQRIFALRAAGAGRGLDPGGLFDEPHLPPANKAEQPPAVSQGPIGLLLN